MGCVPVELCCTVSVGRQHINVPKPHLNFLGPAERRLCDDGLWVDFQQRVTIWLMMVAYVRMQHIQTILEEDQRHDWDCIMWQSTIATTTDPLVVVFFPFVM